MTLRCNSPINTRNFKPENDSALSRNKMSSRHFVITIFAVNSPDCRHLRYDFCWSHPGSFTSGEWMEVLASPPTFIGLKILLIPGQHQISSVPLLPQPPKAFVHMHSFTPQSAMMPEVRALPTPWRANTTCCHSNKTRRQMQPLHLMPFSPPLHHLYWFLLVYLPFFALSRQKKEKGPSGD